MITGHIKNFAKRRNIELDIVSANDIGAELDQVWFYTADNDCEPELMYLINNDGSLTYKGKLNKSLEDLPAWIENPSKLKELIQYLSETCTE